MLFTTCILYISIGDIFRRWCTHWTWGWAGLRAGLGTEARGKIVCLSRGSNPVVQYAVIQCTDSATFLPHTHTHPSIQWLYSPNRALASYFLRFLNHTDLETHGRTPLDEWSVRRRGLNLQGTTQHVNTWDKHPCPGRNSIPWPQQPSDRRPKPRPRGHWHRKIRAHGRPVLYSIVVMDPLRNVYLYLHYYIVTCVRFPWLWR
jgi:hypothetical protein